MRYKINCLSWGCSTSPPCGRPRVWLAALNTSCAAGHSCNPITWEIEAGEAEFNTTFSNMVTSRSASDKWGTVSWNHKTKLNNTGCWSTPSGCRVVRYGAHLSDDGCLVFWGACWVSLASMTASRSYLGFFSFCCWFQMCRSAQDAEVLSLGCIKGDHSRERLRNPPKKPPVWGLSLVCKLLSWLLWSDPQGKKAFAAFSTLKWNICVCLFRVTHLRTPCGHFNLSLQYQSSHDTKRNQMGNKTSRGLAGLSRSHYSEHLIFSPHSKKKRKEKKRIKVFWTDCFLGAIKSPLPCLYHFPHFSFCLSSSHVSHLNSSCWVGLFPNLPDVPLQARCSV